jgi:RHS repeat-associated protein
MTHDATTNTNFSYDAENRITGAAGYTYIYDADGNRVEKSNGSTGTIYWYMTPGIVGESDLTGALKSEYLFFDGERIARRDLPGGSVSYYFSDHLKTASVITDSAGNIKEDEDYYPWGGELQFVNSDSNHYKFTGKERDSETGLDYFGARYYSSPLSRFLTPDWSSVPVPVPYSDLTNPQTLNQYTFAHNNPTSLDDPDGHDPPGDAQVVGTLISAAIACAAA